MRLNKLFIATLLAVSTLSLQSCLKDQEDFFDESSSERLQAVLDNAKTVLMSSENGWLFDYYPDRNLSYGGFVYTVKFDNTHATVGCELAPGEEEKSLYKLTDDSGPVLSFDSYNSLMHFFATPSNGNYEAYDGDFEFMIMNVTDDLITLRGKRTGNTMYLHRLNEDPSQALDKILEISDNLYYPTFEGTLSGLEVTASIYLSDRTISFTWPDGESERVNYVPTQTGIRLLEPIEINGATISELAYDIQTTTISGTDSNGNQLTMTAKLPENYSFIEEFTGSFTFSYNDGKKNVTCTLVPDKDAGTITIKGLNRYYDLIATYNKSYGCMELCGQVIGETSNSQIIFAPGTTSGFFASTAVGYYFIKNINDPTRFEIKPNDNPNSSGCGNSFVLVEAASDGYYLAPTAYRINGDYSISNVTAFVKK